MKIGINDEGDAINIHNLEDLEEYMMKYPSAVLFYNRLCIEDNYINEME
jgi:hypothetical protein